MSSPVSQYQFDGEVTIDSKGRWLSTSRRKTNGRSAVTLILYSLIKPESPYSYTFSTTTVHKAQRQIKGS